MSAQASFLPSTCKAVIRRWRKGHDTWMIGKHYGIEEAVVCLIIATEQDRLHRNRVVAARHRARLAALGLSARTPAG